MITRWIDDLKKTPTRLADRREQLTERSREWSTKARKQIETAAGDGQERLWKASTNALERVDGALDRTDEVPVVGLFSRSAHKLVSERLDKLTAPAIDDYDELNARDAISAIKELDGRVALAAVRRHEAANKNRKTVLRAIDARLEA